MVSPAPDPAAADAISTLTAIGSYMAEKFPKNRGRLDQLTHHLTTAVMVIEHLFDEHARAEHDKAERIRAITEQE